MTIDVAAALSFAATHARIIDRHRLHLLLDRNGEEAASQALAALEAYRNSDGGYGWALEPDLRSATSQPGAAISAFEVWAEVGSGIGPRAGQLCDWLAAIPLPDGGLPFALPIPDPDGCAPWWLGADGSVSSLQITAAVAANAHRVAAHDAAVRGHPWLRGASEYCLKAIRTLEPNPPAHILSYSLRFLDGVADSVPDGHELIERLLAYVPSDGILPVAGGAEGEALRPLDYSPEPHTALRQLLAAATVDADVQRLAGQQHSDGGWPVDWAISSAAATLEWRGYVTVGALRLLKGNGNFGRTESPGADLR
jgi:hypothetical protein